MLVKVLLMALAVCYLTACSNSKDSFLGNLELPVFGSDDDTERQLEVPPDLDAPLPKGDYQMSDPKVAAAMTSSVLPERLDMRLYREGDVVWLAVTADPVSLWPKLRSFYESYGFKIIEANPIQGYLLSDWRERSLPASDDATIRIRDQFRLHIEREPNAITNIYISNKNINYQQGEWRLSRPDLTSEWAMLQSLRDYLASLSEVQSVRSRTIEQAAFELDVMDLQGVPVLRIGQAYSRVWRRLNVALGRSGWKVLGSDRSRGLYYMRYSPPGMDAEQTKRIPIVQLHLLPAQDHRTMITAHLARSPQPLPYQEAESILRSVLNAYGIDHT